MPEAQRLNKGQPSGSGTSSRTISQSATSQCKVNLCASLADCRQKGLRRQASTTEGVESLQGEGMKQLLKFRLVRRHSAKASAGNLARQRARPGRGQC